MKPLTPHLSYTLAQRIAHAEQAILFASAGSWLDQTSCWHICRTYGVPDFIDRLKELRAGFRNELSFAEGK
jgi:hypothetical protein